eukprot:252474_1
MSVIIFATLILYILQSIKSQTLPLSDWMKIKSNAIWNKSLSELTIPGTHDSGAYNLTNYIMPGSEPHFEDVIIEVADELGLPANEVVRLWAKAQPHNLYYQLLNGTRYIDMRCGLWNVTQQWHTYHHQVGQSINYLSSNIIQFLDEHPYEIVIIEANNLCGGHLTPQDIATLCNNFTQQFGDYLYPRRVAVTDSFPTYGQMINSDHRVLISIKWNDISVFDSYPNIWYNIFQNTYADSPNITKMEQFNDQQVELFNNGGTNPNLLFKVSWTLTPNGDTLLKSVELHEPHSLLELATIADNYMANWTTDKLNHHLRIGNIFIYDNYPKVPMQTLLNNLYP